MQNIKNSLKEYLLNSPQSIQEVLFIQSDTHPVWSDNLQILQLAQQQILQPIGAFPDEHIYAFIGMHVKTAITGKRDSIGFLITNFRILTQTDFSVIGTAKNAQIDLFTKTQVPENVTSKVWNDFMVKNRTSIPQEQLVALNTALKNVTEFVLPQLQKENHLPNEVKKASNIFERINELGLKNELKGYAENEKKYQKFSEKYNVTEIICGTVDKPLFGGVYGLVITPKGITSRDLMEDSETSSWQEIKDYPATIGNKKDSFLAGQKNHIIPSFQSEIVPSLIVLINEIANGDIVI